MPALKGLNILDQIRPQSLSACKSLKPLILYCSSLPVKSPWHLGSAEGGNRKQVKTEQAPSQTFRTGVWKVWVQLLRPLTLLCIVAGPPSSIPPPQALPHKLWPVLPGADLSLLAPMSSSSQSHCWYHWSTLLWVAGSHLNLWSKALPLLVDFNSSTHQSYSCPSLWKHQMFTGLGTAQGRTLLSHYLRVGNNSMIIFPLRLWLFKHTWKSWEKLLVLIFKYWLILLHTLSYHLF